MEKKCQNIKVGEIINTQITGISKYGIFVKVNDIYTGMIHISEITDKYVNDIGRIYVIGESVDAKILEIDEEKKQLKLSTKELNSGKNKRKPIKEEGRGFEPLKENLDRWINETLEDLKKNEKTE